MIRLGIVGIAGYGWSLIRTINEVAEQSDCRLVAAADARMKDFPDRARQLEDGGVRLFTDAAEMFEAMRGNCEAMYVATGIPAHRPVAVGALERGYHVHLEKPPAATVQEVDDVIQAAERAGRFCLVGFHNIHAEDVRLVKRRIVEGRLGKVQTIACYAHLPRDSVYYGRNEWAGKLRVGERWVLDGPATNASSHQINNMLFFAAARPDTFANPVRVRGELYAAGPIESHDTAAIEIETEDGPTAYFLASHCTDGQTPPSMHIQGTGGEVRWSMGTRAEITYSDGTSESLEAVKRNGRTQVVIDFVEAVRTGDASLLRCDARQARPAVVAIDGAHESSGQIHRIAPRYARTITADNGATRTVVEDLDDSLRQAAENRCLLSDLDQAPAWAEATQPFETASYEHFPQQFRCE